MASELAEAEQAIVSVRVEDLGAPVEGSGRRTCVECSSEVWISPATEQAMKQGFTGPIGCVQCILEAEDG